MSFPVIKGASYSLFHTPNMTINQGTTQTIELLKHPDSDHIKNLKKHLRSYDEFIKYAPNQVYIGNETPEQLRCYKQPWYDNLLPTSSREGRFGAIYDENELIGLMKSIDVFGLVLLEDGFQASIKAKLSKKEEFSMIEKHLKKLDGEGLKFEEIERLVKKEDAECIYYNGRLVGCVKKAHEFDAVLTSHVMFENLTNKASCVANLLQLFNKTNLKPEQVDYIIECSEEACGDMNQRGGGNIAKAIGEICCCNNATGSDTRSFCAGPVHALIEAAALVKAGVYKNIVVIAGGSTAKLGMNSKSHIEKNMPILEDCLGAFAVHISENDGINPIIRTDVIGRHNIGVGSAPQAVMTAIVTDPLDKVGISLRDIDKFSPEMQNPEITVPAGAGDVPLANFKMITALGVKRGEFERSEIEKVVIEKGLVGYAPTQGHIPSGVPYIGFAREAITNKQMKKIMIIGKGSLFLGRLTNLFDGVSFLIESNTGEIKDTKGIDKDEMRSMIADAIYKLADNI